MIFGSYKFVIRLEDDAVLPYYKGSTFRGVLGHALKKVVCALKQQKCPTCLLRENCTYSMIFETADAIAVPNGSRVSSAPSPLVLEPPVSTRHEFKKGEILDCTLMLFGDINRNLPYFVYAFQQMGEIGIGKTMNGKRSRFVLESVTFTSSGSKIYTNKSLSIAIPEALEPLTLIEDADRVSSAISKITMQIHTPLRIIARKVPVANLPFPLLMRNIIRRTTALLNVYGDGEPDIDYSGLVSQADQITIAANSLKWFDWKRYSSTQDKKMFMGGLVGKVEYQGDFTPFLPFMKMAEKVHIGKNTAFGLGKVSFVKVQE
ncbi:MAG: CRISPR system precrRNA processing endoribonuclease RAMP protein Cas6 [Desulfamplus sp.]|nr:CRISPR system precrRNA processing endoribonuclease RAMP protein Cas6 [Desulfamplus sp.]